MAGVAGEGEAASRFADEARATGLALPTARRLDPRVAVIAVVAIVVASTAIGYATNWFSVSHPPPNPLSELPGCANGGTTLDVATEADTAASLAETRSSLAAAFGAATGDCLTVSDGALATGFSPLSSLSVDAVIGPTVPPSTGSGSLAAATYDLPLFVSPVVVLVNTEGLEPHLDLSAGALAGAYLGTVTSWSDPALTSTNPGLVATEAVSVVYLTGPNEANAVFSTYLASWNASFRASVLPGVNVSWPAGTAAATPAQVASLVAATAGAVGYVPTDVCPTVSAPVACAAVQTGGSAFVTPTASNVAAAASLEANSTAAATDAWTNVTGVARTNSSAYPMLETTYAVVFRDLGNAYGAALSLNASKWLIALLFWVESNTSGTPGIIADAGGFFALPSGFALASVELTLNVTYGGAWILLPPGALQEGYGESGEGGETGEF